MVSPLPFSVSILRPVASVSAGSKGESLQRVPNPRFALILLVVRVKFFGSLYNFPESRVPDSSYHFDHNGLVHFIGHDLTNTSFPKMPLRNCRLFRLSRPSSIRSGFRRRRVLVGRTGTNDLSGSTFSIYSLFAHLLTFFFLYG